VIAMSNRTNPPAVATTGVTRLAIAPLTFEIEATAAD
jgi:enamine deaminase RidA (YjgF/YER057c/UK114 family)